MRPPHHTLPDTLPRAELVAEAGGWFVVIPGLPVTADAVTPGEAINEMVDALREYVTDWRERLQDAPNHRDNVWLVRLVDVSDDDQLRDWLSGGRTYADS